MSVTFWLSSLYNGRRVSVTVSSWHWYKGHAKQGCKAEIRIDRNCIHLGSQNRIRNMVPGTKKGSQQLTKIQLKW
jgi:hypothetical protein